MADLQQEHHREIEGLLENIRQLSRELRLQMLIIDNFIPQEYQVCRCSVCSTIVWFSVFCLMSTTFIVHSHHTKVRFKIKRTTDFHFILVRFFGIVNERIKRTNSADICDLISADITVSTLQKLLLFAFKWCMLAQVNKPLSQWEYLSACS